MAMTMTTMTTMTMMMTMTMMIRMNDGDERMFVLCC